MRVGQKISYIYVLGTRASKPYWCQGNQKIVPGGRDQHSRLTPGTRFQGDEARRPVFILYHTSYIITRGEWVVR